MTDESKLNIATARARKAEALLNDDLLAECFKTLEETYTSAWRNTLIEDVGAREKLFLAINVVGKVKDHLQHVIDGGKMAAAELKELANVAERNRLFGRR